MNDNPLVQSILDIEDVRLSMETHIRALKMIQERLAVSLAKANRVVNAMDGNHKAED